MKILLLAATALFASEVAGPTLGYIAYGGAVRPILGVAGASTLGEPAAALTQAVVAGAYALGCSGDQLVRVDLSANTSTALGACSGAWSLARTGAAVLVGPSSVRIVTADSERTIDGLSAASCAISGDAGLLLCTTGQGIVAVDPSGSSSLVLAEGSAAAFLPGSRDAVLADRTGLHLLRNGSELSRLADVENVSAVAATPGHVIAASGNKLTIVRLAAMQIETLELDAPPSALHATGNADVLHAVTDSGPAWLILTGPESSRRVFVPQPEAANE